MMKTVTATVIYPVYVSVEVDELENEDDIQERIVNKADKDFEVSTIKPIIHECSMSELIE